MAEAPNSGAEKEERLPPKEPMGVRFADTITTSRMIEISFKLDVL
jgi:hypothetical protein